MDNRSSRIPPQLVAFVAILFAGLVVASCGGRSSQSLPSRSTQQTGQVGHGARKPLYWPSQFANPGINECGPGNVDYNVDIVCNVFEAGTTVAYQYQFPDQDCYSYCGGTLTWPTPLPTDGYSATVSGPSAYSSPFAPLVTITVTYPGTPPPDPPTYLWTVSGHFTECNNPQMTQGCEPFTTYGGNGRVEAIVQPPPVLTIVDQSPDNTANPKAAGQEAVLLAVTSPSPLPLASVVWTIPSPAVSAYPRSINSAAPVPLPSSPSANPISFYWIGAVAAQPVKVTAQVYGVNVSAQTVYTAQVPTIDSSPAPISAYGSIYMLAPNGSEQAIVFQGPLSPTPVPGGISITRTVTAPAAAGGYLDSVQTVVGTQVYYVSTTPSPQPSVYFEDANGRAWSGASPPALDSCTLWTTPVPVAAGATATYKAQDWPYIDFNGSQAAEVALTVSFEHYLLFRPSGKKSIWITLQEIDWGWTASTFFISGNTWTIQSSSVLPTPSPAVKVNSALVTWPSYYKSYAGGSCATEPPS
jgi:hypothetical protein